MRTIEIAGRGIGPEQPPFVIAEAGVNHNGQPDLALRLVEAAAEAGADAVKFQTFRADALATEAAPQAAYQRERAAAGSQLEMLRGLELAADALRAAQARATELGIIFLSTPFDLASVRLLAELGVPAFKIGSGDLTNLVLLRAVAAHGRPVLLSTGMASMDEVRAAVADLRDHGNPPLALFHTVSAYPADAADVNLRAMGILADAFEVPVGFSDHTAGIGAAVASASLGAALIEKHLTLDRRLPGPDHAASLEPDAFGGMVRAIREAVAALGDGAKAPRPDEADVRRVARRSLVVVRSLRRGEPIAERDLDAMRPADGISPMLLDQVVGRRAARDLAPGVALEPGDLDPPLAG